MLQKSLHVSPISSASSDRICGIQIHLTSPDPRCITVLTFPLPCLSACAPHCSTRREGVCAIGWGSSVQCASIPAQTFSDQKYAIILNHLAM